jgi:tetratricopeptide (TPR) repeat protein
MNPHLDSPNNSLTRRLFADPILSTIGGVVFLICTGTYLATVSRTTSYWDCGEFAACARILGVPHPPGSPLFVLIGRLFSLLPLCSDIVHRINLLSVFSSAAAVTVGYFVLARLITLWYSDRYPDPTLDWTSRLSIYAGSFCGALMFAFGSTSWSNAVEAEVYGLAMLFMLILIWLAVIWAGKREEPGSDRYLVAMVFLSFLSIAAHLTVFLILPPLFLMIVMLAPRLRRDWRFWLTGIALFSITYELTTSLWVMSVCLALFGIPASYRKWGILGLIWTVVTLGGGGLWALLADDPWPVFAAATVWGIGILPWVLRSATCRLSFLLVLASLIGFSAHVSIPILARQNPTINENNPRTWEAFRGYMERKQYGDESMFARALKRRGEWINQLGTYPRMGFWGFFDKQYGFNDALFLPIFVLGLAGVIYLTRRRRAHGTMLLAALVVTTLALIWYMNFADGTRYDAGHQDAYLEVRDRDYFFTPAFILFGMAIGLGGAALIRWLGGSSKLWPVLGAVVIAALPIRAIQANYFINDRSNNFLAYDYAYNLLNSADQNAIFFTNGDNDTFPLWCAQEVYGIRRDVRIVNLSLLNTNWYIKQLKNLHNIPISKTDDQIDKLVHYRTPDGKLVRIQDQMMDDILATNKSSQTVNFSVTVPESSRRYHDQALEPNLKMIGMAYRLVADTGTNQIDRDRVEDLIWNKFKYRGVTDPSVYKDENALRTTANYTSGFFFTAEDWRQHGDLNQAVREMRRAVELIPTQWEVYVYLTQLYADLKEPDSLEALYKESDALTDGWERAASAIGYSFRRLGNSERAVQILKEVLARTPTHEPAYRTLVQIYYGDHQYDSLLALMQRWVVDNPNDQQTRSVLDSVRALAAHPPAAKPDSSPTPP